MILPAQAYAPLGIPSAVGLRDPPKLNHRISEQESKGARYVVSVDMYSSQELFQDLILT